MHIGLLIYGDLTTLSGGFIYDRIMREHFIEHSDHVTIISIPWHPEMRKISHNFSTTLLERLRNINIDILIQDELNHPSCFLLNKKIRGHTGYPIVALVHHLRCYEKHPWITRTYYRCIEHLYLRSVDAFIYNSATTRSAVQTIVGPRPAVTAHPGKNRLGTVLPRDVIVRRAQRKARLRVLFVGNIIKRKGLHTLLHALTKIEREAWTLTIVGNTRIDEHYTAQIRHYVEKKGLTKHVSIVGIATDRELVEHLSSHDILVVPSSYEGLGIIYMEALAFGLPSIGTTAGGAHEIIHHGINGFLVPYDSPSLLARYLERISVDRGLLTQMSLAARSAYELHPTWSETAQSIRTFLQTLTA